MRSLPRAYSRSILLIFGLTALAGADDTQIPEKPITAEERDHWAFQSPTRPTPPSVKDRGWARNPIDAFVMAALDANGLSPSPEAERTTLLRRPSFDLTGLPPAPVQIEELLNDRLADAYEKDV